MQYINYKAFTIICSLLTASVICIPSCATDTNSNADIPSQYVTDYLPTTNGVLPEFLSSIDFPEMTEPTVI